MFQFGVNTCSFASVSLCSVASCFKFGFCLHVALSSFCSLCLFVLAILFPVVCILTVFFLSLLPFFASGFSNVQIDLVAKKQLSKKM